MVREKDFEFEDRKKKVNISTYWSRKLGIGFEGKGMSEIKQDLALD